METYNTVSHAKGMTCIVLYYDLFITLYQYFDFLVMSCRLLLSFAAEIYQVVSWQRTLSEGYNAHVAVDC